MAFFSGSIPNNKISKNVNTENHNHNYSDKFDKLSKNNNAPKIFPLNKSNNRLVGCSAKNEVIKFIIDMIESKYKCITEININNFEYYSLYLRG